MVPGVILAFASLVLPLFSSNTPDLALNPVVLRLTGQEPAKIGVAGACGLRELKNKKWIMAKGVLFLILGLLSSALLILTYPTWKIVALLVLAIWSFCRFYYFGFYVIENYVDSGYRFSGFTSLIRYLAKRPQPHP